MILNNPLFQPKHSATPLFAGRKESPAPNNGKPIQPLPLPADFFAREEYFPENHRIQLPPLPEDFFAREEGLPEIEKPQITEDELEHLLDEVGFHKDSYKKTSNSPSQGGVNTERLPALRPQQSASVTKQAEPQSDLPEETSRKPEKKRQGLVDERIALIEDYKNGERRRSNLSRKHGIKPHTVDSWIRRFKKNPDSPFFKPTPDSHLSEIPALEPLGAGSSRKRGRENEEFAPEWAAPSQNSNSKVVDWIFKLAADPPSPKPPTPEPIDQEWDSFFDWEAWENRTIPDQKTNLP